MTRLLTLAGHLKGFARLKQCTQRGGNTEVNNQGLVSFISATVFGIDLLNANPKPRKETRCATANVKTEVYGRKRTRNNIKGNRKEEDS